MKNISKILATGAVIVILLFAIGGSIIMARPHEAGPWIDTTDVIADQSADAVGRQAVDPLINTDQGHMLVFFFTLAGIIAGTTIGYYWRKLITEKNSEYSKPSITMLIVFLILNAALIILAGYEAFASRPFINPDLGDVKLFLFIFTGTITGCCAGYLWRIYNSTKRRGVELAG